MALDGMALVRAYQQRFEEALALANQAVQTHGRRSRPLTLLGMVHALAGHTGAVTDYFAPDNESILDDDDLDLGSSAGLILPKQAGSYPDKQGTIYLVDRDNMGKFNLGSNNVIQTINGSPMGYYSSPAYFAECSLLLRPRRLSGPVHPDKRGAVGNSSLTVAHHARRRRHTLHFREWFGERHRVGG